MLSASKNRRIPVNIHYFFPKKSKDFLVLTLLTSKQRCDDDKTTSCAYWGTTRVVCVQFFNGSLYNYKQNQLKPYSEYDPGFPFIQSDLREE